MIRKRKSRITSTVILIRIRINMLSYQIVISIKVRTPYFISIIYKNNPLRNIKNKK